MSTFKRNPLSDDAAKTVCSCLQETLPVLTDLAISAKQIHWNIVGKQFLSVHVKLDEVVKTARDGADVVAERMVQLGHAADGRANIVAEHGGLSSDLSKDFMDVQAGLTAICDRLLKTSQQLRKAIDGVGDLDPMTEDYLIAMNQEIEEQLWMMQAMES